MPNLGDIVRSKEIGKERGRYIWARCPDCGLERWSFYNPNNPSSIRRCQPCHIRHVGGQFKLKG
jgi:ribosomal protein S27E